jgi:hypothetical protein
MAAPEPATAVLDGYDVDLGLFAQVEIAGIRSNATAIRRSSLTIAFGLDAATCPPNVRRAGSRKFHGWPALFAGLAHRQARADAGSISVNTGLPRIERIESLCHLLSWRRNLTEVEIEGRSFPVWARRPR